MAENFVKQIDRNYNTETNVYNSIFEQYERVVIQSLITSFGLDFFVCDQYGGDVDTIHNVRQVAKDEQMKYKNKKNKEAYNNRGKYDEMKLDYHDTNPIFTTKKSKARQEYNEHGTLIKDVYTDKDLRYTKASAVSKDLRVELDHVVECKGIHEDRGRVLSGLSGIDLANSDENLAWTNKSLNASMGSWAKQKNEKWKKEHGCDAPLSEVDMEAYIREGGFDNYLEKHPEVNIDNPEATKERMLEQYRKSRKAYNEKINRAYYTSPAFFKDTAKAAGKVGVAMGLRQALGLVFSEIWFAVRDEIKQGKEDGKALFNSIAVGVKKGLENAKLKYKEVWHKFIEGAVGGVLASLTTTLCNIFFTTAKNVVRIIRQSWASLVEATKILLFNPNFLPFGERFRAAAKIIATGASVVAGTMVGDLIAQTGVAAIPVVGDIVQTFCGTLVTGILSCSLLYLLDRNSTVNKIIQVLNSIPTVDDIVVYYRTQARLLEEYCAKLMNIDLAAFQKEAQSYSEAISILEDAANEQELNFALRT
ncbi:hypothetical protein, partial [Bacteroides acidifaciens]